MLFWFTHVLRSSERDWFQTRNQKRVTLPNTDLSEPKPVGVLQAVLFVLFLPSVLRLLSHILSSDFFVTGVDGARAIVSKPCH
jgi:hypothetical protein